jgi:2-(1,2-epoxy-1,2-dihydrophenyl)acetyl-CoA isomerase
MTGQILYSLIKGVATVTICDPPTHNAIDVAMGRELRAAIARAENDARVLVLTGEGKSFCSGPNLTSEDPDFKSAEGGHTAGEIMAELFDPLVTGLRNLRIPFVTIVNGPAAGFGASLALLGDLILAVEDAYFLLAFRHVGLIPDGGATYLLPRLMTRARAMELALLGHRLDAGTALSWGLINRAFPRESYMDDCAKLIGELAGGPRSLGLTRRAIVAGLDRGWVEQLTVEAHYQAEATQTRDYREGVAAFREKRPPVFEGR